MSKNNGAPGITAQNLKLLAEEMSKTETEPTLALILDEMNIKSQTRYVPCEDRVYGYVDFGDDDAIVLDPEPTSHQTENAKERKVAKNALFYMVNGINVKLKMPIAYALIDKLTGFQKAQLTKQIIKLIYHQAKGIVKVIVFDGDPAHFTMVECLGGSFKIDDAEGDKVNVSFRIDGLDFDIHVMLDLNHMLKLLRNNHEAKKVIHINQRLTKSFNDYQLKELLGEHHNDNVMNMLKEDSSSERKIDWTFLIKLHEFQETTGIRLGNKITKHHLNF